MNEQAYNHWIEVDLAAVKENFTKVAALVQVPVMAVVKADAYGHGAVPTAKALVESGACYLAVTTLQEGEALRQGGITAPILVFCPMLPTEVSTMAALHLTPTIDQLATLDLFQAAAGTNRLPVACKIDTGMGRYGICPAQAKEFAGHIAALPNLYLEQVYSHFANAADAGLAMRQLALLQECAAAIRQAGTANFLCHIAGSTGAFKYPEARLDLVRIGSLLYGQGVAAKELQLATTWHYLAQITAKRTVQKGDKIGYGLEFTADRPMTVGVIPVGYADGFGVETKARTENFTNAWQQFSRQMGKILLKRPRAVLGQGKSLPVLGRIAMQTTVIDLTGTTLAVGDTVEIPMRRTTANPLTCHRYVGATQAAPPAQPQP